jgi:hypothetical protein
MLELLALVRGCEVFVLVQSATFVVYVAVGLMFPNLVRLPFDKRDRE